MVIHVIIFFINSLKGNLGLLETSKQLPTLKVNYTNISTDVA